MMINATSNAQYRLLAVAVALSLTAATVTADREGGTAPLLLREAALVLAEQPTEANLRAVLDGVTREISQKIHAASERMNKEVEKQLIERHRREKSNLLDFAADSAMRPNAELAYSRRWEWGRQMQKGTSAGFGGGGPVDQTELTRSIVDEIEAKTFNVEMSRETIQWQEQDNTVQSDWTGKTSWDLKRYDLHKQWSLAPDFRECDEEELAERPEFCGFQDHGLKADGTTDDFCFSDDLYRVPDGATVLGFPTDMVGTDLSACGRSLRVYKFRLQCDAKAISDRIELSLKSVFEGLDALTTPPPVANGNGTSNPFDGLFGGLKDLVQSLRFILFDMRIASRLVIDTDDFVATHQDTRMSMTSNMYMLGSFFGFGIETNINSFFGRYSRSILQGFQKGNPGTSPFEAPTRCSGANEALPEAPSAAWYDDKGYVYPTETLPPTTTDSSSSGFGDIGDIFSPESMATMCTFEAADDALFIGAPASRCPVSRANQVAEASPAIGAVDASASTNMEAVEAVTDEPVEEFNTVPPPPGAQESTASTVETTTAVTAAALLGVAALA